MKRLFLTVEGIVQGVGFRPFVYNLASSLKINGWVNNNSEGVYIDIEGIDCSIDEFVEKLKNNPPPLARIENIKIEEKKPAGYKSFKIRESQIDESKITLISPDIATCSECSKDIHDPKNRRYGYAFTNCTNCGPRFTIIKSIPYDRDKTTMKKFKMCLSCSSEYTDPTNRRFHAQPNACSDCGPHLWIEDNKGNTVDIENMNPIEWTKIMLKKGYIFAIKGLGGFHLVCEAENDSAVKLLRERKQRPFKPFAVMAKDIETVKEYCTVNKKEEEILAGIRKPIVLLHRNERYNLPHSVAPYQNTLGVMLPYTPLHELLLTGTTRILVMTSANIYGLPLEYKNDEAVKKLGGIVDYFLMHNRDIHIPIDDSVVKVLDEKEIMIRRARGYVPDPLRTYKMEDILATGSNMKNTFCISKDGFLFLSQHNGDLENVETMEHYKRNIEHFKNIFSFSPKYIACDMHPEYYSTEYAYTTDLKAISVQHHHAHIVSCMFENGIKNKVIGLAFDGTGYGTDGKIWGGEFLLCTYENFERAAHLNYVKMPGGEISIKEPWRMAVSYIHEAYEAYACKNNSIAEELGIAEEELLKKLYGEKSLGVLEVLKSNIKFPETSSIGRFFDAVSSIAGIRDTVTYEGQASIELESSIKNNSIITNNAINDSYDWKIEHKEGHYVIHTEKIICGILKDRINNLSKEIISLKFHNTVIEFSLEMCIIIRKYSNINEVALSGGVFQNSYIYNKLVQRLTDSNFQVYTQESIPSNDGGISLGQIVVANEKIKHNGQ